MILPAYCPRTWKCRALMSTGVSEGRVNDESSITSGIDGTALPGAGAHGASACRAALRPVWIEHRGHVVAAYPRSHDHGLWFPPPRMRPEPPPAPAPVLALRAPTVTPPELADYAELCA
jgi:hypothetical protein